MKRITLTLAAIVVGLFLVSRIDSPVQALAVPSESVGVPQEAPSMLLPPAAPVGEKCADGDCGPSDGVASASSREDCGPVRGAVSRLRERKPVRTFIRRVFGRR